MIQIKTEKFQGPLELLLQLIEKEELDITEVSLAQVADQYITYIQEKEIADPELTADFLVIASKLLYIKSKALLPYLYTDEDEEELSDLEDQLKMYKEFLEATKKIEKMIGKKKFMFSREFNRKLIINTDDFFSPPKKITKIDLQNVFKNILEKIKPVEKELEEKKLETKVNIEDKISSIKEMLLTKIKFSFNKILKQAQNKTEVIVSFLAVLELAKQRQITLDQEVLFSEITIFKAKL